MWFTKLIKQFFFWVDSIVYNFISSIYDLMITIARTSVLTQADIIEMADRIYKLLAIFMIFKVTLSLITYVVNPDDFSDKTKGVSKLGTNIVISLALLILTPYIFNYAYQLQTIILEDNSLATLVFGEESDEERSFFNTAGDDMAYITISAFLSPNLSLDELYECSTLTTKTTEDEIEFNSSCDEKLKKLINPNFESITLENYEAGVKNRNLGLLFREDLVLATDKENENFIMDYKFIFSTVVGVVVILLLISFCMDVAVRSIKLAFLQLIAPIPILSFVDPKSGKDGLFKKWYSMCFKTYLSLFIRLLALYFAVYIISKVADGNLVDLVDGSYQTNALVAIFIIIGALMFAKQLPKLLEGLGIKLDGDGKFTLNPFKKFEENAIGGKNITGMARGAMIGTAGALTGAGIGRGFSGAWRGLTSGKGWKETGKAEAEMNRKMRQARLDGSTFGGRMGAKFAASTGIISESENLARQKNKVEKELKRHDDHIKQIEDQKRAIQGSEQYVERKNKIKDRKALADGIKAMEDRAKGEIENGNSWVGQEYVSRKNHAEYLMNNRGKVVKWEITDSDVHFAQKEAAEAYKKGDLNLYQQKLAEADMYAGLVGQTIEKEVSREDVDRAKLMANSWLNDDGMKAYMTDATSGNIDDATFASARKKTEAAANNLGTTLETDGAAIHSQYGKTKGEINDLEIEGQADEREISKYDDEIADINRQKAPYNDQLRELNDREKKAKANESVK